MNKSLKYSPQVRKRAVRLVSWPALSASCRREVMSASARLHGNDRRRPDAFTHMLNPIRPLARSTEHNATMAINRMTVKNILRKINTECGDRHSWTPLGSHPPPFYGIRWVESIPLLTLGSESTGLKITRLVNDLRSSRSEFGPSSAKGATGQKVPQEVRGILVGFALD